MIWSRTATSAQGAGEREPVVAAPEAVAQPSASFLRSSNTVAGDPGGTRNRIGRSV